MFILKKIIYDMKIQKDEIHAAFFLKIHFFARQGKKTILVVEQNIIQHLLEDIL